MDLAETIHRLQTYSDMPSFKSVNVNKYESLSEFIDTYGWGIRLGDNRAQFEAKFQHKAAAA